MVLKRVAPLSFAKISAIMYAFIGILAGFVFSIVSLLGAALNPDAPEPLGPLFGLIFGVGAMIFMPVLYGIMGFVVSLVGAALYNFLTPVVGGIQLDLEEA